MVIQLRIDDRLIHGEVVVMWLNYTNADVVLVADDETANNALLKNAMKLAKPQGVAMPIMTIEKTIESLKEKGDGPKRIFVVTKNAQNARKIAENLPSVKEVNVGAMRSSAGKKQVALKVFMDDKDIEDLQYLEKIGKKVYQQTKPDIQPVYLKDLVEKLK